MVRGSPTYWKQRARFCRFRQFQKNNCPKSTTAVNQQQHKTSQFVELPKLFQFGSHNIGTMAVNCTAQNWKSLRLLTKPLCQKHGVVCDRRSPDNALKGMKTCCIWSTNHHRVATASVRCCVLLPEARRSCCTKMAYMPHYPMPTAH